MKAISIKQPWASLIIEGIKDIENRNWFTYYRGLLHIHAGQSFDLQGANLISELYPKHRKLIEKSKAYRGGILGYVNMVDCVKSHSSPWFYGKYGFVFELPEKMEFVRIKGKLSIFDFEISEGEKRKRKEAQMDLF